MPFGQPVHTCRFAQECPKHGWYVVRYTDDAPGRRGCYWCLHEERKAKAAKRDAVRKPPRPPFEGKTGCAMCGLFPLPPKRRSWCSQDCVDIWFVATSATTAYRQLTTLHGHRCWECDGSEGGLFVDHVRPLWSLSDEERTELKWWLPFNLQMLCDVCHKAKTKQEAGERAELRRNPTIPRGRRRPPAARPMEMLFDLDEFRV